MSFINSNGLDDLAKRLADSVPESLRAFGRDLEGNFKAVLQAQLANSIWSPGRISTCKPRSWHAPRQSSTAIEARLKEIETKLSPQ